MANAVSTGKQFAANLAQMCGVCCAAAVAWRLLCVKQIYISHPTKRVNVMPTRIHKQVFRFTSAIGLTVGLLGCATNPPPPTEQLSLTQAAVERAEEVGARQYAPFEMSAAREKLRRAEEAMRAQDYQTARNLAEQAEADALVAAAKGRNARAQEAVRELQQGDATLKRELERANPPATQPTR